MPPVREGETMAGLKEIKDRIHSIEDTMKITNAMYMLSSSKMQKAKKVLADTEPYFYGMQSAIGRLLRHMPEISHPFFDKREQIPENKKKRGLIIITADKGMAGAYNHDVIRMAEEQISEGGQWKLFVLGMTGRQYFLGKNYNLEQDFFYTVQHPTMHRARVISEYMVEHFLDGSLDEVFILYTQMEGAIRMEPQVKKLLPLEPVEFHREDIPLDMHREEIAMIPSAEQVLDNIVPNYVTGMIYCCLVESFASEHNSRMMAMESSTDNAKEMLKELSTQYNRARQAAITQEITEVSGGARAQRRKGTE